MYFEAYRNHTINSRLFFHYHIEQQCLIDTINYKYLQKVTNNNKVIRQVHQMYFIINLILSIVRKNLIIPRSITSHNNEHIS